MMKVVGLDAGQGWFKVRTQVGEQPVRKKFPTMVEPYSPSGRETEEDVMVEVGGKTYRLFRRGKAVQGREFYFSPEFKVLYLYTLAMFSHAPLYVVTGLPPAYATKENREALREALRGKFKFRVKGREVEVVVEDVDVRMQTWGGALYHYLKQRERREMLAIDIGFYTLDAMEFLFDYAKQDVVPEVSTAKSFEKGVKLFLEFLSEAIYRKLRERIEDYRLLERIAVEGKFRDINLTKEVREARNLYVDAVIDEVVRAFRNNVYRYENVLVMGGGSYIFDVEVKFADRKIPIVKLDEFANAEGFYRWGLKRIPV